MTISDHLQYFAGKPVKDYTPGQPVADLDRHVYRVALEYDSEMTMEQLLDQFIEAAGAANIDALVIGAWDEPFDQSALTVLDGLVARARSLVNLRALFVGDITYEECEMSWIVQDDYAGLLQAYPALEELVIRGGNHLELPGFEHLNLKRLTIQTGGMDQAIVRGIAASTLPALEHLELWLGDSGYGFNGDVTLFRDTLFAQGRPAALRSLGLVNSEIADDLAVWLADTPWIVELESLDLSRGTLSDIGGAALAASPYVARLKHLDLSHHYIGGEIQAKLLALLPDIKLDDPQEANEGDDRYVSVSE